MLSGGRLTAIAFAWALLALALVPALAGAQGKGGGKKHRCAGQVANVVGTDRADTIRLKGGKRHVVASLDGDDRIVGTNARDVICSGNGADVVISHGGADVINTAGGGDTISAGGGADRVSAGRERDRVAGNGGADILHGGREADSLSGGAGSDRVYPGGAKDSASGGKGNDLLVGARGNDRLSGGPGDDTLLGQIGRDRLTGGAGVDVISGEGDTDRISSGPGDDQIDAGSGRDLIDAGPGSDRVDGGYGGDTIRAGDGADLVLGGGGGEVIYGDGGPDRLYGELVDDIIRGGAGDDTIVGGHGVDNMYGNAGHDWLRGDINKDFHWGGTGTDTISYATSTPPGPYGVEGITLNMRDGRALEDPPQRILNQKDAREPLREMERVVGSNYDDIIAGGPQWSVTGLGGDDFCPYFSSPDCQYPGGDTPSVTMVNTPADPGLLVTGREGVHSDALALSVTSTAYVVTGNVTLTAGPGCEETSWNVASCPKPDSPLGYATVYGGEGSDLLSVADGFPPTATILLSGGPGDDVLNGAATDEILVGGPSGRDRMVGAAGDDAIFSGPGADVLAGGAGHDQLVTSELCDGHVFSGGSGAGDIAGFAQNIDYGVEARMPGLAVGRGVADCTPTTIQADNEVLEGTQHGDVLVGDHGDDALILGKQGNDVLIGMGGRDVLRGERGRDALYGGPGPDVLQAFDGIKDIALHCGPGGNDALRDRFDPPGKGCVDRDPRLTNKQKRARRNADEARAGRQAVGRQRR